MSGVRGLREWIVQRLSAVYMAIYLIALCAYFAFHPNFNYDSWKGFFHLVWVEVATLIFLICLIWHAWIGIWTVITDYIKQPAVRMIIQSLVILLLIAYLIWGAVIIFGLPVFWSLS